MAVTLSPAVQAPHTLRFDVKGTRNEALAAMLEAASHCTKFSSLCFGRSHASNEGMVTASKKQADQLYQQACVTLFLAAFLGGASIVSPVINPTGPNTRILDTVKKVTEGAGRILPTATATNEAFSRANQEPTQTQKTVKQTGTQEANAMKTELGQRSESIERITQQLVQTCEIKV